MIHYAAEVRILDRARLLVQQKRTDAVATTRPLNSSLVHKLVISVAMAICFGGDAPADDRANYDEAKVPPYTLPDPLVLANGRPATDGQEWFEYRRPELLKLFESQVYGKSPKVSDTNFELVEKDPRALNGLATKKRIKLTVRNGAASHAFELVCYLPNQATPPIPVFVGILLFDKDAAIPLPGVPLELPETEQNKLGLAEPLPGTKLIETILARRYAVATIDADDLAPDDADRYRQGVIGLYSGPNEKDRQPDAWGAIGAWAWGLSRAMDYFAADRDFDSKRVAVIGHSRRGKTALWAGAQDPRFSLVISNDSGCGGAALSRRQFGETVKLINDRFPHWFALNFRQYNDRENDLPVDQHELIALIAPRPVYVASAVDDAWADPRGEFLACVAADPVYELLGLPGLGVKEMPPANVSIGKTIGYHIRSGKHALTDYDWLKYLDFADTHWRFKVRPPNADL